jgi:hypothetical protein
MDELDEYGKTTVVTHGMAIPLNARLDCVHPFDPLNPCSLI